MPTLNKPDTAASLNARLQALAPTAVRRWGTMDVTAMLCHVGDALEQAMGRRPMPDQSNLFFRTVMKWVVVHLPTPKGAPTVPAMDGTKDGTRSQDFQAARERVLALLEATLVFPQDQEFAPHPAFGPMLREERGILSWKHIDHHLRQFGA